MSRQNSHDIVSLLDDDDDDDDSLLHLQESGLAQHTSSNTAVPNRKRTADTMMTTSTHVPTTSNRTTTAAAAAAKTTRKKTPAKKAKKTFAIIWVCAHGKGGSSRSSKWKQKNLKVVGVYGSKASAESAKQNLMSRHTCCGHGDILVGGTWEDEIDLIIREAPLFMDEE